MNHQMHEEKKGGWKIWLWMALCCIPMIVIVVLLALGYWSR